MTETDKQKEFSNWVCNVLALNVTKTALYSFVIDKWVEEINGWNIKNLDDLLEFLTDVENGNIKSKITEKDGKTFQCQFRHDMCKRILSHLMNLRQEKRFTISCKTLLGEKILRNDVSEPDAVKVFQEVSGLTRVTLGPAKQKPLDDYSHIFPDCKITHIWCIANMFMKSESFRNDIYNTCPADTDAAMFFRMMKNCKLFELDDDEDLYQKIIEIRNKLHHSEVNRVKSQDSKANLETMKKLLKQFSARKDCKDAITEIEEMKDRRFFLRDAKKAMFLKMFALQTDIKIAKSMGQRSDEIEYLQMETKEQFRHTRFTQFVTLKSTEEFKRENRQFKDMFDFLKRNYTHLDIEDLEEDLKDQKKEICEKLDGKEFEKMRKEKKERLLSSARDIKMQLHDLSEKLSEVTNVLEKNSQDEDYLVEKCREEIEDTNKEFSDFLHKYHKTLAEISDNSEEASHSISNSSDTHTVIFEIFDCDDLVFDGLDASQTDLPQTNTDRTDTLGVIGQKLTHRDESQSDPPKVETDKTDTLGGIGQRFKHRDESKADPPKTNTGKSGVFGRRGLNSTYRGVSRADVPEKGNYRTSLPSGFDINLKYGDKSLADLPKTKTGKTGIISRIVSNLYESPADVPDMETNRTDISSGLEQYGNKSHADPPKTHTDRSFLGSLFSNGNQSQAALFKTHLAGAGILGGSVPHSKYRDESQAVATTKPTIGFIELSWFASTKGFLAKRGDIKKFTLSQLSNEPRTSFDIKECKPFDQISRQQINLGYATMIDTVTNHNDREINAEERKMREKSTGALTLLSHSDRDILWVFPIPAGLCESTKERFALAVEKAGLDPSGFLLAPDTLMLLNYCMRVPESLLVINENESEAQKENLFENGTKCMVAIDDTVKDLSTVSFFEVRNQRMIQDIRPSLPSLSYGGPYGKFLEDMRDGVYQRALMRVDTIVVPRYFFENTYIQQTGKCIISPKELLHSEFVLKESALLYGDSPLSFIK